MTCTRKSNIHYIQIHFWIDLIKFWSFSFLFFTTAASLFFLYKFRILSLSALNCSCFFGYSGSLMVSLRSLINLFFTLSWLLISSTFSWWSYLNYSIALLHCCMSSLFSLILRFNWFLSLSIRFLSSLNLFFIHLLSLKVSLDFSFSSFRR